MRIRTVILDFDGTCTDVEQEAQGFLSGYKADLARLVGSEDIEATWRAAEAQVRAEPSRFGMVIGGRLVAPAVDAYLLATSISSVIQPDLGDAEVERLFLENYRFTTTAFKPETRALLDALAAADVEVCVVTNSDAAKVAAKLDVLGPAKREAIRLHGNARKFLVEEPAEHRDAAAFARVPSTIRVAGWPRPIYARRGSYFDALCSIWEATDTTPGETLVVGDVFELDLVLPGTLGCRVHLVPGPHTLDYERRGVTAMDGSWDTDLLAVMRLLESAS